MMDPPRPTAVRAIETCHRAGIMVKMITGDHMDTAIAIAKQLNLNGDKPGQSIRGLNGLTIAKMTDKELQDIVLETDVFARVSPGDKLRLVRAMQSHDKIVAMTGDGVNDAPALRQVNIGIAMGQVGTDVAKDSADIILMDDNFATIEAAVEEGRSIFDNLAKFITWTLMTGVGESMIIMAALVLGVVAPLSTVQVLWINLVTAVLLGTTFAFEPVEPTAMGRPPRPENASIISGRNLMRIAFLGLLMTALAYIAYAIVVGEEHDPMLATTVVVNAIIIMEIFAMFCMRSEMSIFKTKIWTNKMMLFGTITMIVVQIGYTYLPFMQRWFGSRGMHIFDWMIIIGACLIMIIAIEGEKAIYRFIGRKKRK